MPSVHLMGADDTHWQVLNNHLKIVIAIWCALDKDDKIPQLKMNNMIIW